MAKSVVVIAPHPDDETVACGGAIQRHVLDRDDVMVYFLTNGDKAYSLLYNIHSNPTPEELGLIRKQEAKEAGKILGLNEDDLFFLDFSDWNLANRHNEVKEEIKGLFVVHKPEIVYVPYFLSTHPDHQASNKAVNEAITELKIKPDVYNYIIHRKFERVFDHLLTFMKLLGYRVIREDVSKYTENKRKAFEKYESQKKIIHKYREIFMEYEIFLKKI